MTIKNTMIALAVPLGLAGAAGAALAESAITDRDELREMRGVQDAAADLGSVIAAAEQRSKGRVIEAGAEVEDGEVIYTVETMAADRSVSEIRYALDGTFMDEAASDPEGGDTAFDAAKLTLTDAVAKAVADTGGVAMEIQYDDQDGRTVVEAQTVAGDQLIELTMDADDGTIIERTAGKDDVGDDEDSERGDDEGDNERGDDEGDNKRGEHQ